MDDQAFPLYLYARPDSSTAMQTEVDAQETECKPAVATARGLDHADPLKTDARPESSTAAQKALERHDTCMGMVPDACGRTETAAQDRPFQTKPRPLLLSTATQKVADVQETDCKFASAIARGVLHAEPFQMV